MLLNRPSRTLSAISNKAALQISKNQLQPVTSKTTKRSSSTQKKQLNTQFAQKDLNTDELLKNLITLDSQISEVKQIGQVKKDITKFTNIGIQDILPIQINNEDNNQTSQKQQNDDQELNEHMSVEEKLKMYRNNPLLFQKVLLESKKVKQQEINRQREEQNKFRQKHRQQIAGDIPIPPMISNFLSHNKKELQSGKFQYDKLMHNRQIRGQLLEAQIDDTLSRKRRLVEVEETLKYPILFQQKREVLLPRIYALQKQKLGIYLFLVSRISAINKQTCNYQKLKFENIKITNGSNLIIKYYREYARLQRENKVFNAKLIITQHLRYFRIKNQKNIRQKALGSIKYLLFQNYNDNVFLASINLFYQVQYDLTESLSELNIKNMARMQILRMYLKHKIDEISLHIWIQNREKFLQVTLKRLQNDRKKLKELKQFMIQNPAGKIVQPETSDDFDLLKKLQFSDIEITSAAEAILYAILSTQQDELQDRYVQNNSPAQLNITVVNLLPDQDTVERCYHAVKANQDVFEWARCSAVGLMVPDE
ncbi:hypothetical protein SS50377_23081 [Spironucleus salmonicida]|uniref:Uncharacterized protein n=1 Tax=Spironucleus salmonicida TaxID=348837 RepID=V6LTW0_9EUKA|nr:hypothetical protein SS50377_23081 [Spironucleus salmonicida]|eukprot:EST47658.1 hypothetical protein SS50377_12353 [Spironucleus salmonicida]